MSLKTVLYLAIAFGLLTVGHALGLRGDAAPFGGRWRVTRTREISPHCARIDPWSSRLFCRSRIEYLAQFTPLVARRLAPHSKPAQALPAK